MGGGSSRSSPRNSEDWNSDPKNATTVASLARLEAMANIPADKAHQDEAGAEELVDGCRLAYSSVLVSKTQKEAQAFLAHIFTEALTKNPAKKIGGMLFYDEQTSAVVQVLEGPAHAVRSLFHE